MPDVRLTISGDASGAVAAAKQAEAATDNLGRTAHGASKKMGMLGDVSIPSTKAMKNLSFTAFQLTNQMDIMGGAAGQVGAAIRTMAYSMNGAMGPVGILLVALGGVAMAIVETATATRKLDEASIKEYDALVKLGDQLKNHREELDMVLNADRQLIASKRIKEEAHIRELNQNKGYKDAMKGLHMVVGVLKTDYDMLTGANTMASYAQATYRHELELSLKKLAEYNRQLETTTDKMMKQAGVSIKGAMDKAQDQLTKKEGGKTPADPEEAWYKRRLETLKNFEKELSRISEQAKKDREEFDKAYEDEVSAREERRNNAYETMRVKSSGDQLLALNREKVILLRYTNDKLAVEEYYQRRKKQIEAQIIRDSIDNMVKRAMIATSLASALIGAANMSAKGEAEAQMALAGIKALIEGAAAAAAMASALEGKPGMWAAAAQHATAAMEYAAVARQQYKTAYGGGGGAGEAGGGATGEGQGGTTESPRAPTGPVTYYIFSSWTVNGNVIGYDDLYSMWEEFYTRHLRAGGGDINRG